MAAVVFTPVPLPTIGPSEEQAVWVPSNDPSRPNRGWINWFGFMARIVPYQLDAHGNPIPDGHMEKVALGNPAPDNTVFFDGYKFYSQPNFNYDTGQRVDPSKPAYIYYFAAGSL